MSNKINKYLNNLYNFSGYLAALFLILVAIFMGNCLILATITARSTDSSLSKIEKAIEEKEENKKLQIPNISDE